jgi:hypothetical protein
MPILNWLIRPILLVAAVIAGWIVAEGSANFGVIQMAISIILITALVALAAFWEGFVEWWRSRRT